ncbi:MAG: hypothetical protein K2I64_05995 [Muribaculaceae bacterium]|nr:hypothetical protein [Muribaculaceae bacterium]
MSGYDNSALHEHPHHEMDDYAVGLLAPAARVQWERIAVIVGFRLWLNRHATMLPRAHAVAALCTPFRYG